MGKFQPVLDDAKILYRKDKPVFFLLLIFCAIFGGFFFMPTDLHRDIFYISLPLCAYLAYQNKTELAAFFQAHKLSILPVLAYLAYIFISLFWSDIKEQGREFDKAKILLFLPLSMAGLFLVVRHAQSAYFWLVYSFVLSAFFSAIYVLGSYFAYSLVTDHWSRLEGIGRAENSVMGSYLYSLALLAVMYAVPLSKLAWRYRIPIAGILLTIMLLSLSRGPLLALAASIGTLILFKKQYKCLALGALIALLSAGAFFSMDRSHVPIANRGDTGRPQVWHKAVEIIAEKPVFGYGIGSKFAYPYSNSNYRIQFASHPHSFYLATLVQGGAVSLILLLGIMGIMFFKSLEMLRQNNEGWPLAVFVSFAALGFIDFGGVYVNLGVVWVAFWYQYTLIMARENPHPVI